MAKDKVVCGIDVGSSKIATLIATLGEDNRINLIGIAATTSKGVKKGQVVDIEEAVESITESVESAERMAGYSISQAYFAMGGCKIQNINFLVVVVLAQRKAEINWLVVLELN